MSFRTSVVKKYKVQASKGTIKTSEPIKITWEITDDMMIVEVDGIEYAVIDDVSSEHDVDLDSLKNWVEETYYEEDYKSSAYTAPRLKKNEFKKGMKCRSCGKETDDSGLCKKCYEKD